MREDLTKSLIDLRRVRFASKAISNLALIIETWHALALKRDVRHGGHGPLPSVGYLPTSKSYRRSLPAWQNLKRWYRKRLKI